MIDRTRIRDVALVALAQHHGHACEKNADGSFVVSANDAQFAGLCAIYRVDYRPVLTRIKRLGSSPKLHHQQRNALASPATEIRLAQAPKATP